ncbi:MAG: CusA/CzcA family heavy metal efflux RND transporter [Bacteroidetes bacterium]|nr:CusA/CzcA family heavy metal efflux RND transporter [Bacteroidota bacterium]
MLEKIIAFSIKNKLLIGLFIIALVIYGSFQFTKLPIDAVPDITDNQVQVITTAPSFGAPDIERLITFPIEQANSNIPGLKEIRSFSRFGLSLITIVFEEDVNVYWARQQVTERLKIAQEQIPKGIGTPELAPVTTGLGEIYQYVIRAKHGYEAKYDATELRTIQDWIVRRQLLGVQGVADVSSFGGKLKQYEIAVDANELKSYNITINDVFTALEKNNENTGGAYIERRSTVLYIRSEGLIGNEDDIRNIVVKNTENGTPLLINDVAEVRIGSAIRYGSMTYNDEGEAAGAVVMMLKGGNSSEVIKNVKDRIIQIEKTLPQGVEIEPFLDRSKMVNQAIGTVSKNLMEGALIVIFVLVLFLGNFRAGILVASVIPLSMLFAIILMNLFGVSGNLMSLGALDFGLIVDGAVIIVEAVMHGITQIKKSSFGQLNRNEMDQEVKTSASKMMNSAVFGQIIILIVYLPIFSLEGIEGKMFKPMAQTVAFALLGAFILSLTYVPMMSALFLKRNKTHKRNISDKLMDFFTKIHQTNLKKVLRFPKITIAASLGLMAISLFVFSKMGGEFIPTLEEGDFAVETRVLAGSNIATTSEACLKAAHILKNKFPEINKIIGKIGSGEIPTDPMPMEAADIMIILKDKSEWTSAETFPELAEKMGKALEDLPGVTFGFQYPVAMRFNELMTGAKQDVVCKIYGENLDSLSKYGNILGDLAGTINGAKDIYVESITGLPQVIIQYKRNIMAQYGLNISDVNKVINTAFAGQSSGLVFEDEKRFDLVVRLAGENRQQLEDVQNLLIPTAQGTQIPLYQVASVNIQESINQIQRDDAKRRIIVGFNVRGRDVQSIVTELQQKVGTNVHLPSGYYIKYGGTFENLNAAKKRLGIAVPISLILIFILLYFAFNSVKQGLLIYSAIPLSAIGGILFLAMRGMSFSISAGVGFIALFGVAVLNGIVLIAEFNRIKNEGESDTMQIVLQGTKMRLRPVLMTAFVASMGFLPMALSHGEGAEVQRPLATVVIGGLLIATFLTLFVLPVLYILFEKGFKGKFNENAKVITAASLLITGIFYSGSIHAQQAISLNAAIDTAIQNNLLVRNEKLKSEYQNKLKEASLDIPQTNITGEYGQINSIYKDTRIGISQNFSFPAVYTRQRLLQNAIYTSSILDVVLRENELKKQVSNTYYLLLYVMQKQKLLMQSDSIFSHFLEKSNQRFAKGESNILEKITAETQRGEIHIQLKQVKNDLETLQLQFQLLLNTNIQFTPENAPMRLPFLISPEFQSENHPFIHILAQQKQISMENTRVEKSRMLPNLFIGFSNMSIQGTGADNIFYSRSYRFSSVQMGLGVPLFYGSQKAKIHASKVQESIAQNNYNQGLKELRTGYDIYFKKYQNQLQVVNYYEDTAIKNADIIMQTAHKQFENGDINYMEWTMLVLNATAIRSNYSDALSELNQIAIQLQFFTNN